MAKKITLNDVAELIEKGFASVASDISDIKDEIADLRSDLKGDIVHVQEQVGSIEAELRYGRYEKRLGDLEEKVFGAPRR
jgi:hypothetical protein